MGKDNGDVGKEKKMETETADAAITTQDTEIQTMRPSMRARLGETRLEQRQ